MQQHSMASLAQLALGLLLTFYGVVSTCQAQTVNGSCMVHWMVQAGIPVSNATQYETNFRTAGVGEVEISEYNKFLLGFLMGHNTRQAGALKKCLHGSQRGCADYDPCRVNGTCILSEDRSHYKCNCALGYKGKFCEHRIDECASNPCQSGGFCTDHVNHFTCSCAAGYEGTLCENKWLKASSYRPLPNQMEVVMKKMADVEEKLSKMAAMEEKIAKLETERSLLHMNVLGYAYAAHHNVHNNANTGQIATMLFTKKQRPSLLRLSYSASVRILEGAARWYFKIDGKECSSPRKIDIAMQQSTGNDIHVPSFLTGICKSTASGAIGAGLHTISVHIGQVSDRRGLDDAYSGWASLSFLEVQEISPPF